MTWQPDPTTTAPETTVPVATIPNGCGEGFDIECPPPGCVVSDFDIVCTDPTPETTIVTTIPAVESPALIDVCLQHFTDGPTLQPGEYVYVTDPSEATGTTEKFVGLCAPIPTTSTTVAVAEPVPTLPATGGETGWIALTGTVMILTGISLVSMVKGRRA